MTAIQVGLPFSSMCFAIRKKLNFPFMGISV